MMILQGLSLGVERREWTNAETGELSTWDELAVVNDREVLTCTLPDGVNASDLGLDAGRTVTIQVSSRARKTRAGNAIQSFRVVGVLTRAIEPDEVQLVEARRAGTRAA